MNARAIWCLVLCCFLAQSAEALANDQPTDPCKPAEAEDQPKPPAEEEKPVPPAKKPPKVLLYDQFREEFNPQRPHEALDLQTPGAVYERSPRDLPNTLPPLEYPDRFETRYVSANGGIRWNAQWVNVSITCVGEYVGLEEIDDGVWNVYFGPLKLGRLLEKHMRIEDAFGRLKRHL